MGTMTFKQRGKIYALLREKSYSENTIFTWDNGDSVKLSELAVRDNGRAVFLDTRSPKALPFDHARVLIDAMIGLPDKQDKTPERKVTTGTFESTDHWVKNVDPKSPSKDVPQPKVADGWVKGRPTVGERPKDSNPADVGLYVVGENVYKVTESKRNPGRRVAKLIGTTTRGHRKAEYVKGMVFRLTADQKMTPAQAKAYGDKFGQCVNCGKALNDPASVKLGMGPVCHKRLTGK